MSSAKLLFAVFLFLLAPAAYASPVQYSDWTGTFNPKIYPDGQTSADFKYLLDFNLDNLIVTVDNDTANVSGSFAGSITDQGQNTVGQATANLDIDFFGLDVPPANQVPGRQILALGVEGKSTSAGNLDFILDLDNQPLEAENIDVYGGFLNPAPTNGQFGFLAGTSFNFLLQQFGDEIIFDIWVKSSQDMPFTIGNEPFRLVGDIHGNTAVPEPGSMLLLGSGLLGAAYSRRQKRAKG